MALGDIRVELDVDGYFRSVEAGFEWSVTGDELGAKTAPPSATGLQRLPFLKPGDHFWNPEGSQWLLCRPRQFDQDWYKSAFLQDQIVYKSHWTPCSTLSASDILETEPTNLGAGSYPDNLWMSFTAPVSLGTPPISVNFTNLASAGDITLEAGTGVVLATAVPIFNCTPFFQFVQYPDPADQVIFGFGDLCFVFNQGGIRLMRSHSNDLQTWEMLRRWGPRDPIGGRSTFRDVMSVNTGTAGAANLQMVTQVRSVIVALVGADCLFIGGEAQGETFQLRHTNRDPVGLAMRGGKWWLAAFPRQKTFCQTQVVRYRPAEHAELDTPADASVVFFDLGENYTPLEAPEVTADIAVHGDASDPLDIVTTEVTGGLIVQGNTSAELAEVRLIDEDNGAWVSGLGRHAGALRIALTPGNDANLKGFGDTACTSPMIRQVNVRFPPRQTARTRVTGANLTDTQWGSIFFESNLRDPLSKRVVVTLTDDGSQWLAALGMANRSDFPFHVTEDTDGDESFSTVRVRGWCETIEFEEVGLSEQDTEQPVRIYKIIGRGLMYRLEQSPWLYLNTIVATTNAGQMPHTTIPARVLAQSGFDHTDPTQVYIEEDTAEGLIPILPGSNADQGDGVGAKANSPWAPEIDEEKASYVHRIATDWRGWLWWEGPDGQIRYESDPITNILEEGADATYAALLFAGTLYASEANAVAAGKPGQVYLAESQEKYVPPASNMVIVSGEDAEGHIPRHVIDRDEASITGPIATTLNFLGEPTRPARYTTKLGVSESALMQIARLALWRLSRSKRERKWGCPLAPWNIGTGVIPSSIITAQGQGDWFVNHLQAEVLGKGRAGVAGYVWRTFMDCEAITIPEE